MDNGSGIRTKEEFIQWLAAALREFDIDDRKAKAEDCEWPPGHYSWACIQAKTVAEGLPLDDHELDALVAVFAASPVINEWCADQNGERRRACNQARVVFQAAIRYLDGDFTDDDSIGGKWAMIYRILNAMATLPRTPEEREAVAKNHNRRYEGKKRPGHDGKTWEHADEANVRECVKYLESVCKPKPAHRKLAGK